MSGRIIALYSFVSIALVGVGVGMLWGVGAALLTVGGVGWVESMATAAMMMRKTSDQ